MSAPHYDDGLHMMERIGGSFVRSLAACYYAADSENKQRLWVAFREYFERYDRQYREWRERQRVTIETITESEGGEI